MAVGENMSDKLTPKDVLNSTTEIITAVLQRTMVAPADVPGLIQTTYQTIEAATAGAEILTPAVPIEKSYAENHITCLVCGKKMTSLKRHINRFHNLSPDQYKEQFALPENYPMVAPGYRKKRSQLAKKMGLGQTHGSNSDGGRPAPREPKSNAVTTPKLNGTNRPARSNGKMVGADRGAIPAPS